MSKIRLSIKVQSLLALLISSVLAVAFFFLTSAASDRLLDRFFEKSKYVETKSEAYLDAFETFIAGAGIAADDAGAIHRWQENERSVAAILYITRGSEVLYDSLRSDWKTEYGKDVPDAYFGEEYINNDWFFKRTISFADGDATVSFYSYFDQRAADIAWIIEALLSAVLLCAVFVWFIRRKINYVIRLEEEIKILETGGLDYPITVRGNDELASLAANLDQMRLALSDNIRTEAAAVRSNYDLVVAVSHDIRTPLTSLALYLDLILTGKYREPDQVLETVEKARGKVTQIKQMTDQLFERFIFEKNEDQPPEAPAPIRAIFEDALSGAVGYLEENGFQIKADVCWPDRKARVVGEYVSRIVDNLCSNILKYAEPEQPVLLSVYEYENDLRIRLSNKCRRLTEQPESTGIGLENVRFMMHRMGGACRMTIANGVYTICLTFRCTTDE